MVKKILILLAIMIVAIVAVVYVYRYAIIRHYAEKIIRENLPAYIKIDKINFDFANNAVSLDGLKVLNPPEFSSKYLLEIKRVNCRYGIKGKFVPEGLGLLEISFKNPNISVERLRNGAINLVEMERFIKGFPPKESRSPALGSQSTVPGSRSPEGEKKIGDKKLSDIIKLPPSFGIRDAKIEFLDRSTFYDKPHLITVESVTGEVSISFDDYYSRILNLAFTLDGNLNGEGDEVIKWVGSLNPATPKITMSNRFEVENLDIISFEPYYDKFSPFIFKRGKFSGTLVFDFNNGDIGSTNEVRLSNILFWIKPGYENAQMWETNVQDLLRYFTTTSGDIVFDFKIKGDMANPTFYLGPISKRAMASMAIDKISSYAVDAVTKSSGGAAKQIDKAKEYIDLFKGLINRK